MRMKIVQVGDPVLRQTGRTLTKEEIRSREIQDLIAAMRETMYDAPGVGLAAPQIGLSIQLAVIEDKPEYVKEAPPGFLKERERKPVTFHVIINPKLTLSEGERVSFYEGCLSLTGFTAVVPRARSVRVECLDHRGEPRTIEASGWYARILQHEIDHLNGTVYIDRMHSRTFSTTDGFNAFWKDKSVAEVKRLLDWER
ncbi:MAG: peptide deformylase [Acidobacteriaceae bacterium]|nr:peptide deformylase [Acidobacteriaceae bacterium]MBV9225894.1 peptide deformylase [Acidobacteriaceae bacterium]MBV9305384.1 peptide deformylase [Acidobacteriaceae bacterium]MBV9937355.1 peptide deformylase [Acidobacteriaceae bacterium]